jgi:carboxyl-terminal processing protease
MGKTTLLFVLVISLMACVRQPSGSAQVLYEIGFQSMQNATDPFPGWQAVINDGYTLTQGTGIHGEGRAMTLSASEAAKAILLARKIPISKPSFMRFNYTGYLKTSDLVGESSIYMRVYAGDEVIFQDDLKGYALSGDQDWTQLQVRTPGLSGVTEVEFGIVVIGAGTVSFDDVSVKMNTNLQTDAKTLEFARQALEAIELNSMYDISPDVRQAYVDSLNGAREPADVYGSIVNVLTQMGDQHAKFIPAEIRQAQQTAVVESEGVEKQADKTNLPVLLPTPANIGYIRIPAFKKGRDHEEDYITAGLKIAQAAADNSSCGWVIDLRNNTGGSMWPMLAVLEPWLSQEVVGYMHLPEQSRVAWRVSNASSYLGEELKQAGNLYEAHVPLAVDQQWRDRSIAVLINRNTGSSGEAAAMAFKGQDHVLFIGQKTSGLTTGISQIELQDGSLVRLSIAEFLDRNGQAYPDGLTPDVPAKDALETAYELLGQKPGCQD